MPRAALVDQLMASRARVVAIVAPPGYGKSAVLAQWAERLAGAAVWHTCTEADNDPVALLTALGRAAGPGPGVVSVAGLVSTLAAHPPRTLLLDDLQAITHAGSINVLTDVVDRLPETWRVGFTSRARPRLPVARLRASGQLLEMGSAELALRDDEVADVLARTGITLAPAAATDLLRRTEGWPVSVWLAALALHAGGDPGAGSFTGDDAYMREYLRTEVLAGLSARETALLVRCSILDELSGPVCDAVLRARSSGAALEHLAAHGVVQPVDRGGERYRCHPLLQELLAAELHRKEPELVPELHRRAGLWYADADRPGPAVAHARLSHDLQQVADLVLRWAQPTWAAGGIDIVRQWMSWLEEAEDVDSFPAVAAHASLVFALVGDSAKAEQWSARARATRRSGPLPDGSTVEGVLAYLHAIEARHGTQQMRLDARTAWNGLSPASPFRATMLHTEGLAALLEGDLDAADDLFVDAMDAAEASRAQPLVAVTLCERAAVAVARDDWPAALAMVDRAGAIVDREGHATYWTSALVHAWAARAALHRGLRDEAIAHTRRALAVRHLLTPALPVVSTQALLVTARAALGVGDLHAAASAVRQAEDIVHRRPGLGDLPDHVAALAGLVHEAAALGRTDPLTPAEVRLMPLLATHLTFPLIAERLGVSRNTVKTQAISTYRKLGVSSRNEAVAVWEQLDGSAGRGLPEDVEIPDPAPTT